MMLFGGRLKEIASADPAAGAEISITVPDNKRWLIISLSFSLVTDATVANRNVNVIAKNTGGNVVFRSGSNINHTASTTKVYGFAAIGDEGEGLGVTHIMAPTILVLDEGMKLETATANLQAADNFGIAYGLALEIDI